MEVSGTQSHLGVVPGQEAPAPFCVLSMRFCRGPAGEASTGVQAWDLYPQPPFPKSQVQAQSQADWNGYLSSDTHLLCILGPIA